MPQYTATAIPTPATPITKTAPPAAEPAMQAIPHVRPPLLLLAVVLSALLIEGTGTATIV